MTFQSTSWYCVQPHAAGIDLFLKSGIQSRIRNLYRLVSHVSCLCDSVKPLRPFSLGGVPREQNKLKGPLLRVIYHQVYENTKIRLRWCPWSVVSASIKCLCDPVKKGFKKSPIVVSCGTLKVYRGIKYNVKVRTRTHTGSNAIFLKGDEAARAWRAVPRAITKSG